MKRISDLSFAMLFSASMIFLIPIAGCGPSPQKEQSDSANPGGPGDLEDENENTDAEAEGTVSFDLPGEIMLDVSLDPAEPKAGESTHIKAKYASAYGRPITQLSIRLTPADGKPTDWQELKMTGGLVWDAATDEIIETKDPSQDSPGGEYGASIYEGDIVFPAGQTRIEFKDSEETAINIEWSVISS